MSATLSPPSGTSLADPHARQIVVISDPARHGAIRDRFAPTTAVELFAVDDLPRALSFAVAQRPQIVALDAGFACTVRGRTLINTLLKNRTLAGCEIRVVTAAARGDADAFDLDPACRRTAERVAVDGVTLELDGQQASLVNLSARGIQVLSPTLLKPNQRLRVALTRGEATARAVGTVVWATFEMPNGEAPRYRAGLQFGDAHATALRGFLDQLG